MASTCTPLPYFRAASPAVVSDSRFVAKQVQTARVSALISLASSKLVSTKKSRGHVLLASDSSDFSPFTVEELEGSSIGGAFSDPAYAPLDGGSESVGLGSGSSEEADVFSEPAFTEVEPPQLTKLYVGNLPWDYTSEQLDEMFKEHGSVFVAEVVLDKATGRSRGFGFVYMNSPQDAEVVIEKLNGKEIQGRTLKVNYQETAEARSERLNRGGGPGDSNVNKLFVANLPWSMMDEDLERIFSEFGAVVNARVILDRDTGRSRGFGFVSFSSSEEVEKALAAADSLEYDGRFLRVAMAGQKPAARSFY